MRASIRPVTVSISIGVLFGCTLFAQSYSPMYAPASGNLQSYTCDYVGTNIPIPGAVWWIDYYNTGYFNGTNDHLHYNSVAPYTQLCAELRKRRRVRELQLLRISHAHRARGVLFGRLRAFGRRGHGGDPRIRGRIQRHLLG